MMSLKPNNRIYQPVDLPEIVKKLYCDTDPSKNYLKILNDIFNNQYCYVTQWEKVVVNVEVLIKLMDLIRRYEANGLQMEGRVLWIFSILLPIYTIREKDNVSSMNPLLQTNISTLMETLLRILFEQKKYYICIEIIQFVIEHYNVTIGQILEIGISIADQLPITIPSHNFVAFLHFALRNITMSNISIETKTEYIRQLVSLISIIRMTIEQIYVANYFMGYIIKILNSTNSQNNDLFTIEMLNLFSLIIPLHPNHSKQVFASDFPSIIINLLIKENDITIKSKFLNFFSALCIDMDIREKIQQLLPLSLFDISSISVCHENSHNVESLFSSFITIFKNKIEYYQHHIEDSIDYNKCKEYFSLIEMFIQYQITLVLNYPTETNDNNLNNSYSDISNIEFQSNEEGKEDLYSSLNSMIKTLSRIVDIRLISEEVNKLLIAFLEHLYKEIIDFNSFQLHLLDLVDTMLYISYRHLESCWFLCIDDVKDVALLRLSKDIKNFFLNCHKAGLLNSHEIEYVEYFTGLSNLNTAPVDNINCNSRKPISENIVSQVLKMQYLTISYLDMNRSLVDEWVIEDCNIEPIESVCRKVLLVYLSIEVFGHRENRMSIISQDSNLSSSQMTEILLELLNDERLGMSEYPKMQQKCIQVLGSIITFNENLIENRLAIYEYVISVILNKEHTEKDLDLLYSSLSCLLALSYKDRNIRRKIVTSLIDICNSFASLDSVNSMQPLLNLCEEVSEFSSRFEYSHEECVLYIIISALRSYSDVLLLQGLKVMYLLGVNSPGFVNRCYCRPELEDLIINILWKNTNCEVILAALKVLTLMTREVNMKPFWLPSRYSYGFEKYTGKLSSRKLYQTSIVDLLVYIKNDVPISSNYRLVIYSICLSIASNLMYGCSDGSITISSISDSLIVSSLKEKIMLEIVSWIPYCLEFYSILKNKKNLISLQSSLINDDCEKNNGTYVDRSLDSLQSTVEKSYIITEKEYNSVNGFLIAKVVDSIYSFFCLEGAQSLKVYKNNVAIFSRNPIIASLSFIMLENINNLAIQQRGINIIKFFAEHKVDLPTIGMHSPSVLINAVTAHIDVMDINISFCNIIISLAKSDEFVRENLIRFNISSSISKIMFTQISESCRLACICISELIIGRASNVALLCQNSLIIESILAVLDSLELDLRVQIEGLRALVMIDRMVPELLLKHKKLKTINILKKSTKFLVTILKQEKYTSEAERQEIEELLSSSLCSNDFCCIS